MKMKKCSKCGEEKPATTEYFYRSKSGKYGLCGRCKTCRIEDGRRWYEENREVACERHKRWHVENREIRRAIVHRYLARKRNLLANWTRQDETYTLEYWNYSCPICGRYINYEVEDDSYSLAFDHWIPLASDDCIGTIPSNMLPMCHGLNGCNNSKGAKDGEVWLIETLGEAAAYEKLQEIYDFFDSVREVENANKI